MTEPVRVLETESQLQFFEIPKPIWYFGKFEKVDAEQRIVEGYATAACVDLQNDFISYNTSKAAFATFMKECGGSVREMHQPKAVGKVVDWHGDDAKQAIFVSVYISKSREGEDVWTKIHEGILKAFSIGGKAEAWTTKAMNGQTVRELTKITIRELSLVDVPANPEAKVTLFKADESVTPTDSPSAFQLIGKVADLIRDAMGIQKGLPNPDYGSRTREVSEVKVEERRVPQTDAVLSGATSQSGVSEVPTGATLLANHPPATNVASAALPAMGGAPTSTADVVGVGDPTSAPSMAMTERASGAKLGGELPMVAKANEDNQQLERNIGIAMRKNVPWLFTGTLQERLSYGDPVNVQWPCDTEANAQKSVQLYNGRADKVKYTDQEWHVLGRRISRLASSLSKSSEFQYHPRSRRIERVETKGASMKVQKDTMVDSMKNLVVAAQAAAGRGENVDNYLVQMCGVLDVAEDQATNKAVAADPNDPRIAGGAAVADASAAVNDPIVAGMGAVGGMGAAPAAPGGAVGAAPGVVAVAKPVSAEEIEQVAPASEVKPKPAPSSEPSTAPEKKKAAEASTVKPPSSPAEETEETKKKAAEASTVKPSSSPASTAGKETPTEMESDTKKPGGKPMGKSDEPLSSATPQAPNIFIPQMSDLMAQNLPSFMAALEGGSLKKAQEVAGHDQFLFDEMFHKSCRALLTQGGWTMNNIQKIGAYFGGGNDNDLQKAIVSTDIPGLYLQRLAKLMLPVYAGLRRRLPAQTPPIGAVLAQWRAELGFQNFSFAQALYNVPEASGTIGSTTGTGQQVNESFLLFQSPFKRIALNDAVTLEAIAATRGYDDPLQVSVIRALTALIISEERKIYGDNSAAIPAMGTVTTALAAGGSLVNGTPYTVKVSALSYIGYLLSKTAGFAGAAAAGETAVLAGTVRSATTASGTIDVTWACVKGAVAYNVYVYNGSNEYYHSTVTLPRVSVTAMPSSANAGPTTDNSANANGYEGVIEWAMRPIVYGQTIPSKTFTDQAGAGLTSYAGGITEFDTVLQDLWANWQIAPSLIITSPRGSKHLTKTLLSTNSPAIYRMEVGQERGTISGGAFVTGYVNKFAPYADGTPRVIDVMAHPYAVDDGYHFLTESINYPLAREARGFALDVLIPYTYFPLAQTTIHYPFAMLCSETLECFHPSAQACIMGVNTAA